MTASRIQVDGLPFFTQDYKSEVVINKDFCISFTKPMPNAWHRFWMRFLLGWEWRKLKD